MLCVQVWLCVLVDNASLQNGEVTEVPSTRASKTSSWISPLPWGAGILPVECPFPNPSSQYPLVLSPSICALRMYSEIHILLRCWYLKIRLPMSPHGHATLSLTVLLSLWPVIRESSSGKEISDGKCSMPAV